MNIKGKLGIFLILTLAGCTSTMPKLGITNGNLNDCPNSPNCVSSHAQDSGHAIQAITFAGSPDEAKARILNVINSMKRTNIVTQEDDYIHVEFTSMLFRFVDDVEFYFPQGESNQTLIQVRSASRTGHSDFGVNRKRIEAFREQLK